MANFNKVLLMGNLTRDPQLSYLPSQTAVVEIGLAINRKWRSREGEEKTEICFIDCNAFGKTAENINKYLKKGNPLFVEGRLKFDQWTAQDGSKRSKHRVTIENFQFMGSPQGQGQNAAPNANAAGNQSQQQYDSGAAGAEQAGGPIDDIPF